ncbi:MAG: penicillin-binding protein [Treponema sp. GWB1_62_6]|nr:MAG: penicillin-binding protein [Treponema sp. GWB1_62_6]OHE66891.1 MAG: penicillin-binding protein [Treponema sp. GWC1_61_84]OHE76447.1 MAG: penicillin-binding protein [Treponema sp. RIFOXYC1_FULL_61_9]
MDSIETYVSARLRSFIAAAIALLVFVTLVAMTVFFLAVRGAEQTMVPDIKGKELTAALLELQVKELYPRIQLRYSQTSAEKGTVLEQDPSPGAIVKAGRRVKLVVSRGVVVDKIEDFTGQNLDDVKMHIQTLFSTSSRPLLSVREPPAYKFSPEAAGTILEQKPEPGVEVSGPMKLEFVVSRGPENAMVKVPDLVGLPVADALERIRQSGIFFSIQIRPAAGNEAGDTVVSQLPAGQEVVAANTRVALLVSTPTELEEGELFGLFSRTLPDYPYPLSVKLEALLPTNERRRIFSSDFPGGEFSVPFRLPEGSTLILSVLNREILREDAVAYVAAVN